MAKTRVVILAAGQGKRMGATLPKPLVPVAGKPMIVHLVERVVASGVNGKPIVVVAPDCVEQFKDALGDSCEYALQEEQLGTGHAVMCAKENLVGTERVVVLYGDHPFIPSQVLRDLVALHDAHPNDVAMLTSLVPNFDPPYDAFMGWGRVIRGGQDEVIALREIRDASEPERTVLEVNPGIYAFPCAWLWERLPQLHRDNAGGEYYLTELIGMALEDRLRIYTAPVHPLDVMGINTPEELTRVQNVYKDRNSANAS